MPPAILTLVFDATATTAADAAMQSLKQKGVKAKKEVSKNGNIAVKWISSFAAALSNYLIDDIKNDENIDTDEMKVECNFSPSIMSTDVNLAIKQASNVRFSFIDNKMAEKMQLGKLNNYRINDLGKMEVYFEMIEQNQILSQNISSQNISSQNKSPSQVIYSKPMEEYGDVEQWWLNQTDSLRSEIQNQLTEFEQEFELVSINLLFNSKHAFQFMQHDNFKSSMLMFHGTSIKALNSIFQNGFVLGKGKSAGKLYGNGHYFTPQILHSIRYLTKCKDYSKYSDNKLQQYTLIAAFVNPGKIYDINTTSYRNKDIVSGYDSHHCKVMDGIKGSLGCPVRGNYKGDIMDEYAIRESTRILPRFYITLKRVDKVFVWRDKKIANHFNGAVLNELKSSKYPGTIYGVTDTKTALNIIQRKMKQNLVYVITNGADDGEGFVDTVRNVLKLDTDILVFCSAVEWHSKWASLYQNVYVKCGKSNIVNFVKSKYATK